MFLDKLTVKQLNAIAIISIVIATLSLVLTIVLPFIIKTKKTNDFTQKCSPSLENTDLWAKFPGQLQTTITHNYSFYDFNNKDSGELTSNISIREEISYSNFVQNETENTIYFDTNRTYKYIETNDDVNKPITSVNMGLFEALETITYPTLYKIGINAINYIKTRVLIEPDLFIRELFTYKLFNELDETTIKEKILNNLPQDKVEKILSTEDKYKEYSFKNIAGFFKWIKIMGIKEKIDNSNWLVDLFDLTEDEISSILQDQNGYLITQYKAYNSELIETFECENRPQCGIELLYTQLINGSVISSLKPEIKDYLSLNKLLQTNYYPFDKTPEMVFYFDEEYKKKVIEEEKKYNDFAPTKTQLDSLLNINSENCLLSPKNSIYLLHLNKTENRMEQKVYYLDLTYDKINFLSDYFYDFLPNILLYPEITENNDKNDEDKKLTIDPIAKTVSTMIQTIADKTYKLIYKLDLYNYILKKVIFDNLKEKIKYQEIDEICPIIMQKVFDDGKKVNKICTDPNLAFDSEDSLYKWVAPYYCLSDKKEESKCDMTIINYLKNLVYISDSEIESLYSENSLGGFISSGLTAFENSYNCGDRCSEKQYLNKIQFWTGNITLNAPSPLIKSQSLSDWFPEEVPYPVEISYYQKKYNNSEVFTEEEVNIIISLISEGDNKNDLEHSEWLLNKFNFEKEYTLFMNQKLKESSYNLIDFLIDAFIFSSENDDSQSKEFPQNIFVEYSSLKNFIQGNREEDLKWINYLSSGDYFDNFKPDYTKTTGLDIGIDLDTKKQYNFDFDNYGIITINENYDKRKINKMNGLFTLNIKKEEYDYLEKKYTNIFSPLYNFERLVYNTRKFSDGFQYDQHLKVIYYYDPISSRPYRFKYTKNQSYKGKIECRRYDFDVQSSSADLNEKLDLENPYAMITQKTNKPILILPYENNMKNKFTNINLNEETIDNYICVDPISDMVIDSSINLFYVLYTRNYGYVNKKLNSLYLNPIFTYQRKFEVEVNSYEQQFPGVTEYYSNFIGFVILGISIVVIFCAIAIISFILLKKKAEQNKNVSMKQSLVKLTDSEFTSNSNRESEQQKINNN